MCGADAQEVQKKTLEPHWEEDKWLLVQEPKTQALRLQLFDHDAINLKARARLCTGPCIMLLPTLNLSGGIPASGTEEQCSAAHACSIAFIASAGPLQTMLRT